MVVLTKYYQMECNSTSFASTKVEYPTNSRTKSFETPPKQSDRTNQFRNFVLFPKVSKNTFKLIILLPVSAC
jgi:hypothetical protein